MGVIVVVLGCGAAAVFAVLSSFAPAESLSVRRPGLGAQVTAVAAVGALWVSWIAVLRAERTRTLGDAALALGIAAISAGTTLAVLLGHSLQIGSTEILVWVPLPGIVAAGVLLVATGRLGWFPMAKPPRRVPLFVGTACFALVLALAGAGIAALGAGDQLPPLLHLVIAAPLLAATGAIVQTGRLQGDSVLLWWAAALPALAVARPGSTLSGASEAGWFTIGDLVFLAAVALLVAGARAERVIATRARIESARDEERRRLAREMHDGLAQELAFVVSQSRRLAQRSPNSGALELLARAGETALTDTRRAIFTLKRPGPGALSTAIVERAFLKAERAGLALDVEVLDHVRVSPDVEHALLSIVDEAISNVARHAAATSVSITIFSEQERVLVRVRDNGKGFDRQISRRRFGLDSMTERAELLGGRLRLESAPGYGALIEVAI